LFATLVHSLFIYEKASKIEEAFFDFYSK